MPSEKSAAPPPLAVDPATGHMTLWGMPAWIMSPQYHAEMQAELETLSGKAAKGMLYRVAFRSGRRAAAGLQRISSPGDSAADAAAGLQGLVDLALAAGHGFSEIPVGDVAKRDIMWIMPWSLLATLHAPSKESVCHYYEGFLAGFVTELLGSPVEARETECRAKGDARLVFRTKPIAAPPV